MPPALTDHSPKRRRVLLCASGLSPQVVTETTYALAVGEGWVPDEVHLCTTTEGAERARLWLLSDHPGWFQRLRKDFALPPIRFDSTCVHVLGESSGRPLEDIRSAADNVAAADDIIEWVRTFAASDDTELHVSLAGGRKTMGFMLGYALSLLGRDQDRLSHVLVDAPFEGTPDFFYPTREERIIQVGSGERARPADCRDARVTLAEIPFVRLRHGIDQRLLQGRVRFAEAVASAQPTFAPPQVRIEVDTGRLFAGGREVEIAAGPLAFYLWFARRAQQGLAGLTRPAGPVGDHEYAAEYLAAYDAIKGRSVRTDAALRDGMLVEDFDVKKTKAKEPLNKSPRDR